MRVADDEFGLVYQTLILVFIYKALTLTKGLIEIEESIHVSSNTRP